MKKRSKWIAGLAVLVVLIGGCYPQGPDFIEDLDIVVTRFEDGYNFSAKQTYARPDKIVKVTGDRREGEDPEYIPDVVATPILAAMDKNMTALGYTKVDVSANPDLLLTPASWETTTISYYYDYWYWWYGGYYPYYGWGYPAYVSSYTTGTLFMALVDPDVISANGNPIRQWSGAANGILTYTYDATRITRAVDKAFAQSPYLKTN
jgi:hypothetical protein